MSRSCGAGKDEAEDIAQDVMLRLWQMHDELDRYEKPEALVALMTRHLLRNHQRRRKPELLDEAMVVSLSDSPHDRPPLSALRVHKSRYGITQTNEETNQEANLSHQ